MQSVDLNGTWELKQPDQKIKLTAIVPGQVQTDLMRAGIIKDPHVLDLETEYLWIGQSSWEYTRTFALTPDFVKHTHIDLVCDGLDTLASIEVNGTHIAECDNMFRQYVFDVKPNLRAGENQIRILFRPVITYAEAQAKRHPYSVPYNTYFLKNDNHNFVRKSAAHFGWDWGPCLLPVGIWRAIRLEAYQAARLTYVTHTQVHHADGTVTVSGCVFAQAAQDAKGLVRVQLAGQECSHPVIFKAGENRVVFALTVNQPALWWPNGFGDQALHTLYAAFTSESGEVSALTQKLGFRTVELIQTPDEQGESFYFQVNQVPVFIKGANWIPADSFESRVSSERLRDLLASACMANMNMLRVWGGGVYEQDAFYSICDELGLLVWQDFMFACALYPADKTFCRNVEREARHQVRRLAWHPCLALWCGNNENEQALLAWYPDVKSYPERFQEDYQALYLDTLAQVVREEDGGRAYWSSSPSNGTGSKGDPNDPSRGDTHEWLVWHSGQPVSAGMQQVPRFVSEFGFQSYPSKQSLAPVLGPNDWELTSPLMEYRQRCPFGNRSIYQQLMRWFKMPKRFEDFLYVSQILQALMVKLPIEHWRRSRRSLFNREQGDRGVVPPKASLTCMGVLYWQLNDIWPGPSWSSLEYDGGWKVLHDCARHFFAPVLVSIREIHEQCEVWMTNDLQKPIKGQVSIEVWTWSGEKRNTWSEAITVPALASCRVWENSLLGLLGPEHKRTDCFVLLTAQYAEGSCTNVHYLAPLRQAELEDPNIDVFSLSPLGKDFRIVLHANQVAPWVVLSAEKLRGYFSDNAFLLLPGQEKEVVFHTWEAIDADLFQRRLKIRSLRDSYL